jgi:hypothetical protein
MMRSAMRVMPHEARYDGGNRVGGIMLRAAILAALTAAFASSAGAYTEHKLHSFCSHNLCNEGNPPVWGLTMDTSGNLYGVTAAGGAHDAGTAYALTQADGRWKAVTLANFPQAMAFAGGRPIVDGQGNLYGVNDTGVYELILRPGHKRYGVKTLYTFRNGTDGGGPHGRLSYLGAASGAPYDGVSPLYGAAALGGNNNGVLYSLTPAPRGRRWKQSVIYTFCVQANCADGAGPDEVTVAGPGKIYGATYGGGYETQDGPCYGGCGIVYELDLDTKAHHGTQAAWTLTVLHTFCSPSGCADGQHPLGPLTIDGTGALFGTTYLGGANGNDSGGGTIFKLVPNGTASQHSVLYSFCALAGCTDGSQPDSGVVMDANGVLFGTTDYGGSRRDGEVFRFDGSALSVAYSFCQQGNFCSDGDGPSSALVLDAAGDVYGTTLGGGVPEGGGIAFELVP